MREGETAMTNEEKKAILSEYRTIDRRIRRLLEEKQRWRDTAAAVSPRYSQAPKGTGAGSDKIQAAVCRMIELEQEIAGEAQRLADLRGWMEAAIRRVEDGRLRELLRVRYIDGCTWEQVAEKLEIDERWARRLHGRALDSLTLESPPFPVL